MSCQWQQITLRRRVRHFCRRTKRPCTSPLICLHFKSIILLTTTPWGFNHQVSRLNVLQWISFRFFLFFCFFSLFPFFILFFSFPSFPFLSFPCLFFYVNFQKMFSTSKSFSEEITCFTCFSVPNSNLFVQLNPVQVTLDTTTCIWFNRFLRSIFASAVSIIKFSSVYKPFASYCHMVQMQPHWSAKLKVNNVGISSSQATLSFKISWDVRYFSRTKNEN